MDPNSFFNTCARSCVQTCDEDCDEPEDGEVSFTCLKTISKLHDQYHQGPMHLNSQRLLSSKNESSISVKEGAIAPLDMCSTTENALRKVPAKLLVRRNMRLFWRLDMVPFFSVRSLIEGEA